MDEETKKGICPLCGSHEYEYAELSEDIKDDYLEAMLGEVPFTRTYDILGGRLAVTVSALSDYVTNLKAKLFVHIVKLAETTPDIKGYIPQVEQMSDLDCQVISIRVNSSKDKDGLELTHEPGIGIQAALGLNWDVKTVQEGEDLIHKVIDVLTDSVFPGTTIPKPVLRGVVGKHNVLISRLMQECLDVNFLNGTGR